MLKTSDSLSQLYVTNISGGSAVEAVSERRSKYSGAVPEIKDVIHGNLKYFASVHTHLIAEHR